MQGVTNPTPPPAPSPVVKGGTLILDRGVEPQAIDPLSGQDDYGAIPVMIQLFDQLVEILPGSTHPQPGLATSWDISSNGTVYTFHLRNAKFCNGQPVTASDWVFSLQKIADPKTEGNYGQLFQSYFKHIQAVNASTLQVTLTKPWPAFLNWLTFQVPSVVPKAYYEKIGTAQFNNHPIGSGAFCMTRWVHGQEIDMVKNPYYWRAGEPYLDAVQVRFITNDNTRVLNLRSGTSDILDDIPFQQFSQVKAFPGVTTQVQKIAAVDQMQLNEMYKPLADPNVRLALSYATPRAAINRTVFRNLASPANSSIPALENWDPSVPVIPYDPAKAKALMAKTAYPHGFHLNVLSDTGDSAAQDIINILNQTWAPLGVTISAQTVDNGTLQTDYGAEKFQGMIFPPESDSSDLTVEDQFITEALLLNNAQFSNYKDPTVTALSNQFLNTQSPSARKTIFGQLQRRLQANPNTVTFVFSPSRTGLKSNVHGFVIMLPNWFRLDQVWKGH